VAAEVEPLGGAEAVPDAEAKAVPGAAAVGRREAAGRRADGAGTARWVPDPEAVAESGAPRWARRADWGAESAASQDRAAEVEGAAGFPCRANQAARGVAAAASSPAQLCLIALTWRVNARFGQTNGTDGPSTRSTRTRGGANVAAWFRQERANVSCDTSGLHLGSQNCRRYSRWTHVRQASEQLRHVFDDAPTGGRASGPSIDMPRKPHHHHFWDPKSGCPADGGGPWW
jgi:hypothetical protein